MITQEDIRRIIRDRFKITIFEAMQQYPFTTEIMHKLINKLKEALEKEFELLLFKKEYSFTENQVNLEYWYDGWFNQLEVIFG